eukprot:TRINITY_DN27367_c0_g1_i1.p1 TRINITY_DN27367_c0_g1~~TRINITY_DN27367_c0_g1_i1.p1  ORF type:complete len:1136 (+),score=219.77 TRINITY_DN27367_c0_g1_i1:77-3484(+)
MPLVPQPPTQPRGRPAPRPTPTLQVQEADDAEPADGCLKSPSSHPLRQQRVQYNWEDMKRKMARRAGRVAEFEERPRLLALTEDLDPSSWERSVEIWPEVARASDRLRPQYDVPEVCKPAKPKDLDPLEESARELQQELIPWLREVFGQEFVDEYYPAPAEPPPSTSSAQFYRHGVRQAASPLGRLQKELAVPSMSYGTQIGKGLRQQLDKLSSEMDALISTANSRLAGSGLECEHKELQPRTTARQIYDVFKEPHAAADEFSMAKRKLERKAHRSRSRLMSSPSSSRGVVSPSPSDFESSPRKVRKSKEPSSQAKRVPEQVRGETLQKLDYVNSCRACMGEMRFSSYRQRFEVQSALRVASKYSVAETPEDVRSAFSRHVRGCTEPGAQGEEDEEAELAQRPATAPELSPREGSREDRRKESPRPRTASSCDKRPPTGEDWESATRAYHYASKCEENRVVMPNLGTFGLAGRCSSPSRSRVASPEVRAAPSELKVAHWSLGDRPLVALTSSPIRDSISSLEHGDLRGNRISNEGVSALVDSLGPHTTELDLSDNCFDSKGAEVLARFVKKGGQGLKALNLSGNRLSDASVAQLCRALASSSPMIQRLCLADVQMGLGIKAGAALGALLETAPRMKSLDVSYNMLQDVGALSLLEGLSAARLEYLNLGWNCLGQGTRVRAVAELLANILRESDSLCHLDLGHNRFKRREAEVLAQALKGNRTLFGLHLEGNAMVLDVDGFVSVVPDDLAPEVPLRLATARGVAKKKEKGSKKAKSARGKDEADLSASGLTPQQLQDRSNELEIQLRVQDLTDQFQSRKDDDVRDRIARSALALSDFLVDDFAGDDRLPISMPVTLEKFTQGEKLDIKDQERWLQEMMLHTTRDTMAALQARSRFPIHRHGSVASRQVSTLSDRDPRSGEAEKQVTSAGLTERIDVKDICWICNPWVEVVVQVIPGVSVLCEMPPRPPSVQHPGLAVCALFAIDNFSRPVPLEPDARGIWRGSRFLPACIEPIFMILQIGDRLMEHQGIMHRRLDKPLQLKLWRVGACGEDENAVHVAQSDYVNLLRVSDLAANYCSQCDAAADPVDDERPVWVSCTTAEKARKVQGAGSLKVDGAMVREELPNWHKTGGKQHRSS